jgi:hypothetical protein
MIEDIGKTTERLGMDHNSIVALRDEIESVKRQITDIRI